MGYRNVAMALNPLERLARMAMPNATTHPRVSASVKFVMLFPGSPDWNICMVLANVVKKLQFAFHDSWTDQARALVDVQQSATQLSPHHESYLTIFAVVWHRQPRLWDLRHIPTAQLEPDVVTIAILNEARGVRELVLEPFSCHVMDQAVYILLYIYADLVNVVASADDNVPSVRLGFLHDRAESPRSPRGELVYIDVMDHDQLFSIEISGEPKSKERPRASRGSVYTPDATRREEARIASLVRAQMLEQDIDIIVDPVSVQIHFDLETARRKDLDNLVKLFMDAVNKVLWEDDHLVHGIHATLARKVKPGRTVVTVCRA